MTVQGGVMNGGGRWARTDSDDPAYTAQEAAEFLEILCSIGRGHGQKPGAEFLHHPADSESASGGSSGSGGPGGNAGRSSQPMAAERRAIEPRAAKPVASKPSAVDLMIVDPWAADPRAVNRGDDPESPDAAATGDRADALPRVHNGDDLPRRWSETSGGEDQGGSGGEGIPLTRRAGGHDLSKKVEARVADLSLDRATLKKILEQIDAQQMEEERGGGNAGGGEGDRLIPDVDDAEGSGTVDQAVVNELLSGNDEEAFDNAEGERSPKKYRTLRGGLTGLKDNLSRKAGHLGGMLKTPCDYAAVPSTNGGEDTPPQDGATVHPRRPVYRKASAGDDGDDDDNHGAEDSAIFIESAPIALSEGERRRPRTRRTTQDSGMWTALSSSFLGRSDGSASAASWGTAGSHENSVKTRARTGSSNEDAARGECPEEDVDEEGQQGTGGGIALDRIRGRLAERRASMTPFIDDEGNSIEDLRSESGRHYHYHYHPGRKALKRCVAVLLAVALAVLSSFLVGYSVPKEGDRLHDTHVPTSPDDGTPENSADDETLEKTINAIAGQGHYSPENLFQMAKSVDEHCHSGRLSTTKGRWECQQICHDHLCCFAEGGYNCRDDGGRLCPIFSGCQALVLEDFKDPGGSNAPEVNGGAAKEDGIGYSGTSDGGTSGGGTTHGGIGYAGAGAGADEQSILEEVTQKDLGWMEIRRKYIRAYCAESNVATKAGRKQCEKVCDGHFCCFDFAEDGSDCRHDKSMTCDVYAPCGNMLGGLFDDGKAAPRPAGLYPAEPEPPTFQYDVEGLPIPPGMAGDILPPPLDGGAPDDPSSGAADDGAADVEYTREELVALTADVKQRCGDYLDPTGRLHCERICRSHFCCFSREDGCRDDPAKLCGVYAACKVLRGTSPEELDSGRDRERPAQAVLISPELEEEMMMDGEYSDYNSGMGSAPGQDGAGRDSGAEGPSPVEQAATAETDFPTMNSPNPTPGPTPEPTTGLTREPTPDPTPAPSPAPTPPPVEAAKHAAGLRPPPLRCVPDGDDEVNTEVYSDDWNDDRFDRCKRWEKKHGMTVAEYWDLIGIDSDLEKDVLGSMLVMDGAAASGGDGSGPPREAPPPREDGPGEEILDDLDDTIIEDEDELDDNEFPVDDTILKEEDNLEDGEFRIERSDDDLPLPPFLNDPDEWDDDGLGGLDDGFLGDWDELDDHALRVDNLEDDDGYGRFVNGPQVRRPL